MAYTKIFLDTNILMDFLCHREHLETAATILDMGRNGDIELYCTTMTIANCLYNCRKVLGKNVIIHILKEFCTFIHISPSGQTECDKAFGINATDFEDALQYFSAESIGADVIVTRNPKDFRYSTIPVMNGEEFLNAI